MENATANTAATETTAQSAQNASTTASNGAGNTNTQTNTSGANNGDSGASKDDGKNAALEELIQRAVDRATNKLGNENKKLRGQIDDLKKANLSESELKQLAIEEKEKEIAEREKQIQERENRLIAIKAIKEIGLDDGSDASLALVDFVMAEDEDGIKARVKSFNDLVKRFVQSEVDKTFKANGRTPAKGSTSAPGGDDKANSYAVKLGQNTAKANKAAQSTLDYYIGGKKA